ncbi:hypothetical protein CR513_21029, partial [Mucuna pruriens]
MKDPQGNVERHKAKLVAKGFTQREGINYIEIFSYIKESSLRAIMILVAHFDFELHQMNVKTTFLNGDIGEEVCMKQLEGFSSSDENIMDNCIYLNVSESKICFLMLLYVNDILLETNNNGLVYEIWGRHLMLLPLRSIEKDLEAFWVCLKKTYINKVLERFNMKDYSQSIAPTMKGDKLNLS